jgi:hypothetical protein
MSEALKRYSAGEKVTGFPSRQLNAWTEAAEWAAKQMAKGVGLPETYGTSPGLVVVWNASGADCEPWTILGIDSSAVAPASDRPGFETYRVIKCVAAAAATHRGRFVVLQQPLRADECGMACAAGVTIAKLTVNAANDRWADAGAGVLATGGGGAAEILWKESGTGADKWSIVRLGAGIGPGVLFAVTLTQTGGSAGSSSAQCSFTYTVKTLAGDQIGAAIGPQKERLVNAVYTAATQGVAYFETDGTLRLWDCDERASQTNC